MNDAVKTAALELATKMVAYQALKAHCETSTLREDKQALRNAFNDMVDAQNDLYHTVEETTESL